MGMESYSIILVSNQVDFKIENSFWKLQGNSDIMITEIVRFLETLCKKTEGTFVYNKIIDVFVIGENEFFQGLEIKGCLSCFNKGLEEIFDLYEKINIAFPVNIVISNQKEKINEKKFFIERMYSEYEDKFDFFQKQYGKKELIVSIKDFYRYNKKRKLLWWKK